MSAPSNRTHSLARETHVPNILSFVNASPFIKSFINVSSLHQRFRLSSIASNAVAFNRQPIFFMDIALANHVFPTKSVGCF
jgi:hypothetical protein